MKVGVFSYIILERKGVWLNAIENKLQEMEEERIITFDSSTFTNPITGEVELKVELAYTYLYGRRQFFIYDHITKDLKFFKDVQEACDCYWNKVRDFILSVD